MTKVRQIQIVNEIQLFYANLCDKRVDHLDWRKFSWTSSQYSE